MAILIWDVYIFVLVQCVVLAKGNIFFSEVSSIHGTLIDNTGYRNTLRSVGIAYRFPRSPTWTSTVKDS